MTRLTHRIQAVESRTLFGLVGCSVVAAAVGAGRALGCCFPGTDNVPGDVSGAVPKSERSCSIPSVNSENRPTIQVRQPCSSGGHTLHVLTFGGFQRQSVYRARHGVTRGSIGKGIKKTSNQWLLPKTSVSKADNPPGWRRWWCLTLSPTGGGNGIYIIYIAVQFTRRGFLYFCCSQCLQGHFCPFRTHAAAFRSRQFSTCFPLLTQAT